MPRPRPTREPIVVEVENFLAAALRASRSDCRTARWAVSVAWADMREEEGKRVDLDCCTVSRRVIDGGG